MSDTDREKELEDREKRLEELRKQSEKLRNDVRILRRLLIGTFLILLGFCLFDACNGPDIGWF